ncbi:hypothetical protein [Aquimarina sp. 2201CG5-10]|uniref:hypothetical protein n=1 Tax=Aquimarina callyspongiae TaxID=3098150 RepID=UPI002AB5DA11|nr:hypothetical protein [Aquimarina sp. 2201CG5-10]MDY8138171.1 hypothetical protein [Aquimarina sp. 2201CG5-10]
MKLKITVVMVILLSLIVIKSYSQSKNYGSISYTKAMDISGKQRTLSQKMSKAYILITKGINNREIKRELEYSRAAFQRDLDILKKNASSAVLKLNIKNIEKIWNKFKKLADINSDYNNSLEVMELNTDLLKACDELTLSIQQSSNYNTQFFQNKNQDLVETINTISKQRMLSQRLCLYYIVYNMFPDKQEEHLRILNQTFNEFNNTSSNLLKYENTSKEIRKEINIVKSQWKKFQINQRGFINHEFALQEVIKTTNSITESYNKITKIYLGMTK